MNNNIWKGSAQNLVKPAESWDSRTEETGGGGGNPHKKVTGTIVWNFEKSP